MYPANLTDEIFKRLTERADRPALSDPEGAVSGNQLREASGQLAAALLRTGLRRGQRLLLGLPPGTPFVTAALAALRLGSPFVPISARCSDRHLAHVLHDCGPRLALATAEIGERVRAHAPATRAFDPDELVHSRSDGEVPLLASHVGVQAAAADPALILYTSGSSGKPKGVVHTQGSLGSNLRALQAAWAWSPADHLLLGLPLYHLHGLVVGLLGTLFAGAHVELMARFEVEPAIDRLASGEVSIFYGVPTMYRRLAEHPQPQPLTGVRLFVCGSAALPGDVQRRFEERFGRPVLQRYGTTETGIVLAQRPGDDERRHNAGRPVADMTTRIVCPDTGQDQSEGELWVQGPALFSGYFEDEDATRASYVDGYYRTGDLVRIEPGGGVRILGRLNLDILKVHGHRVGALEIEAAVEEHEQVQECAVLGRADADAGEVPVAFVVTAGSIGGEQPADHCRPLLASYQQPREFRFLKTLPRIGPSKVDKQALRRELEGP